MAFPLIERRDERLRIEQALRHNSAVAVVGPRQCGKTTLCREFVLPSSINYFDLESPESVARLDEPVTALSRLNGLVLIDEIQNRPELFSILRVLIDRKREPGQYLLLGSASINFGAQ
jgi:predicted AAA+ superfamily ATPase